MNRVFLRIFFPSLDTAYEFIVSITLTVQEVIDLLCEVIAEKDGIVMKQDSLVLYLPMTGEILNETYALSKTSIRNGSTVYVC